MTTSTTQESKRKPWWLLAVAILAVGGLVAAAMAMTADGGASSRAGGPSPGSIGDPEIRQAKWRFTVKRAGKKLSKNQRASFPTQRKKLKTMAQDIFDALFLSPEEQARALRANFTSRARKSYQRAGVGVPKGAGDVRIRRRSAWIVIDQTARATMSVNVVARGQADNGPFATTHRSVLYVAREKGGWKVFGYEVDQGPFKKRKPSDNGDKPNDKQNKSSEKGKKNKKKRSGDRNRGGDGS